MGSSIAGRCMRTQLGQRGYQQSRVGNKSVRRAAVLVLPACIVHFPVTIGQASAVFHASQAVLGPQGQSSGSCRCGNGLKGSSLPVVGLSCVKLALSCMLPCWVSLQMHESTAEVDKQTIRLRQEHTQEIL